MNAWSLSILLSKPTPHQRLSSREALGLHLTSMSMQHNELFKLEATIEDSNNSDSEATGSDATIKADQETDLKYLYYRLFTDKIGITSRQPAFVDNPYLGRVNRNSIAPPQAVLQLKRRLCHVEEIADFSSSTLYHSTSNQSPMDDGDVMDAALGSTVDQPMELVVKHTIMTRRKAPAYPQPQYIYYCLYTEDGVINPKRAFKTYADDSPSIARIDKNLIPPLHNLDAVIRCISYVEKFSPCVWHQIFPSIVSASPVTDLDVWGMQDGCPGSLPERPLVFVRSSGMERRMEIPSSIAKLYLPGSAPVQIYIYGGKEPHTDGVIRREVLSANDSEQCSVYRVCTAEGKRGFIKTDHVRRIL